MKIKSQHRLLALLRIVYSDFGSFEVIIKNRFEIVHVTSEDESVRHTSTISSKKGTGKKEPKSWHSV